MDLGSAITLTASITAIVGFVYFLIIGQKAIPEWLKERKEGKRKENETKVDAAPRDILKTTRHNLPSQTTSFIGREKEIEEVKRALSEYRLVTLTGSGGTGKTRLSLQVATSCLTNSPMECGSLNLRH